MLKNILLKLKTSYLSNQKIPYYYTYIYLFYLNFIYSFHTTVIKNSTKYVKRANPTLSYFFKIVNSSIIPILFKKSNNQLIISYIIILFKTITSLSSIYTSLVVYSLHHYHIHHNNLVDLKITDEQI